MGHRPVAPDSQLTWIPRVLCMKPISDGFDSSKWRIDVEDVITAIDGAKMRFFVRARCNTSADRRIAVYFPPAAVLEPVPDEPIGSPQPATSESGAASDGSSMEDAAERPSRNWDDPFVDASVSVDAIRISYLAPAIHFNYYLDWLLFDFECERGLHPVHLNENRPSNISRRAHFEAFAHAVLIALKSGLDRLVAVAAQFVPGISGHMTWGRIKDGKASNFMSVVVRGKDRDDLLAFLHNEYTSWIEKAVVPRDDIIHYADLQTTWRFRGWSDEHDGYMEFATHCSVRGETPTGVDLAALHHYVTSYYALAERVLLTLATRLPLAMQKRGPSLGSLIVELLGVPPGKRVGKLKRAIELAIKAGELESGLPAEAYIDFLRKNPARFELPTS